LIIVPHLKPPSTLVRNLLSMSTVQAANVLLPIITFPYLVRVLGFEQFGLVNYALALVSFFVVFVDFGYNLTGTRDVAAVRDDRRALSALFSTKWAAQGMLLLVASAVFIALVLLVPKLQQNWPIYALTFGLVPATILLPAWYFQGTEQFHLLARLQLASRGMYAIGIFTLVKSPADSWLVPLLNSVTGLAVALIGVRHVFANGGLTFMWPGLAQSLASLRQGTGVFASSFAVTAYNYSALLILGSLGNDRMVGQFAAIEKILLVFRSGLSAFFAVMFPRTCQLAADGPTASAAFLRGAFKWLLPALLVAGLMLLFLASPVLRLVVGSAEPELILLLSWMAWVPLLIGMNMPSYQQLLAHRQKRSYTLILTSAAVVSILLNLLLTPRYGPLGTVWAVLFAEIAITAGLLFATEVFYRQLSVWRKQP
jgi:polysaccharide transporter, PST family